MQNIQNYRQPVVTATGIFLGFMLNFGSSWIKDAFTKNMFRDIGLGLSIIVCISLLLIVLFRILKMNSPTDKVSAYYRVTLRLFNHCRLCTFCRICVGCNKNTNIKRR